MMINDNNPHEKRKVLLKMAKPEKDKRQTTLEKITCVLVAWVHDQKIDHNR